MKKIFALLFAILITNQIFAQTENYKASFDQFQTKYNDGKYDEIFNKFSMEMKQGLPLESTKEFLTSLKSQVGKIENKEFSAYEQKTYANYKTKFEKAVLSVNISLNENNQINGLFIKPFVESTSSAANNVNALSKYPKEIAQSNRPIFEHDNNSVLNWCSNAVCLEAAEHCMKMWAKPKENVIFINKHKTRNQSFNYNKIATMIEKEFNESLPVDRNGKFREINDIFYKKMGEGDQFELV